MIVEPKPVPNVYYRILCVMNELSYIAKGDKMVNGQYRFVSHDQVTAKIHPLLVKYGLVVIPSVIDILQDNNRTCVKLGVNFINVDDPKDGFQIIHCGYGVDNGDKGPGKAVSYAYKYALLKTFCLETGDDPDYDADASYEPPTCLEFDSMLPEMNEKEKAKLLKFLAYSSICMKKHIEDVKREAVLKMPEFLAAFKKWNPKTKDKE